MKRVSLWFVASAGVALSGACTIEGPGERDSASSSSSSSSSGSVGSSGAGAGSATSTGAGAGMTGSGAGMTGPMGIAVLGNGEHSMAAVDMAEIGTRDDGLNIPNDLAFNPLSPTELWVVNSADDSMTVFVNPGAAQTVHNFWGQNSVHFLANPSGLAFGDNGFMATIHQEDQKTQSFTPWDFMGPTLWTGDLNEFDGDHASHYDMLHNSPNGMGIAWESGNTYWVFDGEHSSLTRYAFNNDHGPGGSDHTDGDIARYAEGEVSRVAGVASHMEYKDGLLYVADTGNNRIAVLDTSTGTPGNNTTPNHDSCDQYRMNGAVVTTLIDGSEHGLQAPSGLAIHDDILFITDNATSTIYGFSLDGQLLDWLETDLPPGCLMGIELDAAGNVWTIDAPNHRVISISARE